MRCAEEPGRRNSEKKKATLEQRDGVKIQHVSRTGVVASPESGRETARHLAATPRHLEVLSASGGERGGGVRGPSVDVVDGEK